MWRTVASLYRTAASQVATIREPAPDRQRGTVFGRRNTDAGGRRAADDDRRTGTDRVEALRADQAMARSEETPNWRRGWETCANLRRI